MFNLHLCVTEQAILLDLETKTNLQTCDIVITMKMIIGNNNKKVRIINNIWMDCFLEGHPGLEEHGEVSDLVRQFVAQHGNAGGDT